MNQYNSVSSSMLLMLKGLFGMYSGCYNDFEQSQGRVGEWQCLGLVSQKHLSNSSLYETSVSVDQVLSAKSQIESIVTLDL